MNYSVADVLDNMKIIIPLLMNMEEHMESMNEGMINHLCFVICLGVKNAMENWSLYPNKCHSVF
jgi:hypothetical protein